MRIPAFILTPLSMSEMKILGGKPDLPKLAKKGRIKMSSNGEVVGQAKNPILHVDKKPIKVQDQVIGYKEIVVNGGHATREGSVWRVALGGPTKYHAKAQKDERRKEENGGVGFRPAAPTLDFDTPEYNEYQEYKAFLKEKGVDISTDEEFYTWKSKPKAKAAKKTEEIA